MRQGGPRTPSGWNQVIAVLIEELLLLWANKEPAVSWAPEWKPFEILVWADNIFLVSSSIIDIVQKTQDIEHVFGKKDLCFNQKSLEILPSKSAEENVARVWLNEKMEFSWVSELVVLGCHLDGDTSSGAFGTGTEDVWQNAILAELLKNSLGRTPENVLLHCCAMRLVGLRLLDSVD